MKDYLYLWFEAQFTFCFVPSYSALMFLPKFGEVMEKTEMWPEMKDYFYMMNWVLNYRPDNTTQAANCKFNSCFLTK